MSEAKTYKVLCYCFCKSKICNNDMQNGWGEKFKAY